MEGSSEITENIEEENGETASTTTPGGILNCANFWHTISGSGSKASRNDGWEVKYKDITEMIYLGSGAQGVVCRGKLRGEMVAVKKVNDRKEIELKHIRHLNHDNVIKFIGVCVQSPDFCIIMEYCQYGSLYDFLQSGVIITPKQIQTWSNQIATGMAYLHSKSIIHRDLKSPNILIGDGLVTKLSDFGTSRQWDNKSAKMTFIGTVAWMAPEVIRYDRCTDRIDVWSYGVVLWELLTLERPYGKMEMNAVIWGVGTDTLSLPLPASFPKKMRDLISRCWNYNPEERPTFKTILLHLVPAAEELYTLYTENYTEIQQVWRDEVNLDMANILSATSDESTKNNPTRREQLIEARELRNNYQEKVKQANNIYMDACSVRLQLEQREKHFQEFVRDQACRCVHLKRTLGFVRGDCSTTPPPPKPPVETVQPKRRPCMADLFLECKPTEGRVVAKSRNPPVKLEDFGAVPRYGDPGMHIPGFL